jgi:hypothetical protein
MFFSSSSGEAAVFVATLVITLNFQGYHRAEERGQNEVKVKMPQSTL